MLAARRLWAQPCSNQLGRCPATLPAAPEAPAAGPGMGLSPELKSAIDQFITENKVGSAVYRG